MIDKQLEQSNGETAVSLSTNYHTRVSQEMEDSAWDQFLAQTPGGHHVQTSLWAQVKGLLGWRAVRLVVRDGEQIVAGAQILIRALPGVGAIGYLSNGPLFARDDPALMALVTKELQQAAKAYRIHNLVVQPPLQAARYAHQLSQWGFRPSNLKMGLGATVLLDLTPDLDTILAQMKSKTRYNVRLSQRKGITVREGTAEDLPTFYRLLIATGERQRFTPNSEEYFAHMMRILEPHNHFKLFFAEYEGEAVSGLLAIPFGDTVIYKRGAWAGAHGEKRPNEALHWATIQWAKGQGYRYYDFEGIQPRVAKRILNSEPIPDNMLQTVTRFKLGFNGQVTLLPDAYEYLYNPVLRWSYNTLYSQISTSKRLKKALKWLRRI